MNLGQWVFLVFIILSPFEIGVVYLACQFIVQKMPKQKQESVERIARITDHFIMRSVQATEQANPELSGKTKKELATRMIMKRLNENHVPINAEIVDTGIDAIVLLLPKTKPEE